MLREALAMGADEAILGNRQSVGRRRYVGNLPRPLQARSSNLDYDLIITGRQAIDGDTAQVGPQISEHLGIPNISYAQEIKVEGDYVIVKRQYRGPISYRLKAKMPCLITALDRVE